MEQLFWFLVIGLVAGWLAGEITKGSGLGLSGNLIIGVIGALVGGLLFNLLGLSAENLLGSILVALASSVLFLYLMSYMNRAKV